MFDTAIGVSAAVEIDSLDADTTLTFVSAMRVTSEAADVSILAAAAHWADLHGVLESPSVSLPGMQRLVQLGGDGTPQVAEFAPAELGAELSLSTWAAGALIGDALDLRHRLPTLWARVQAGEVKPWIGRKIAQATRSHSADVATAVDDKVAKWADRLGWGRLESLVDATIIDADLTVPRPTPPSAPANTASGSALPTTTRPPPVHPRRRG